MFSQQEEENKRYQELLRSAGYPEADKWEYLDNGQGVIEMKLLASEAENEKKVVSGFEKWWWDRTQTQTPSSTKSDGGFFGNEPQLTIYKLDISDILKLRPENAPKTSNAHSRVESSVVHHTKLDGPTKRQYMDALERKYPEQTVKDIKEGADNKFRVEWKNKAAEYHELTYFQSLLVQPTKQEEEDFLKDVFEATTGERPNSVEFMTNGNYKAHWGAEKSPTILDHRVLTSELEKNQRNVNTLVAAFEKHEMSIRSKQTSTSIFKSGNALTQLDNAQIVMTQKLSGKLQGHRKGKATHGQEKAAIQEMIDFRKAFREKANNYVETLLKNDNHKWGYDLLKVIVNKCKNILPTRLFEALNEYAKTKGEKLMEDTHAVINPRGGTK